MGTDPTSADNRWRRAIDRKFHRVEVLPEVEAVAVLELDGSEDLTAEEPERCAAE
jgi:hypothetical protein